MWALFRRLMKSQNIDLLTDPTILTRALPTATHVINRDLHIQIQEDMQMPEHTKETLELPDQVRIQVQEDMQIPEWTLETLEWTLETLEPYRAILPA